MQEDDFGFDDGLFLSGRRGESLEGEGSRGRGEGCNAFLSITLLFLSE